MHPAVMSEPRRIVSLVPSTTETLFALDRAERIVGRTRYCIEPGGRVDSIATVGGTKNPRLEQIAALEPDLVLANAEENRAEDLAWLEQRFRVLVQTPRTVADVITNLRQLGQALGAQRAAGEIVADIDTALREADRWRQGAQRRTTLYVIWPKPWMSISGDTYIADMMRLAGLDNATESEGDRYPSLSEEQLVGKADLVLLPDEPWEFTATQRDELEQMGTFGDSVLICCSGRDFCWHGAHTATGVRNALDLARRAASSQPS